MKHQATRGVRTLLDFDGGGDMRWVPLPAAQIECAMGNFANAQCLGPCHPKQTTILMLLTCEARFQPPLTALSRQGRTGFMNPVLQGPRLLPNCCDPRTLPPTNQTALSPIPSPPSPPTFPSEPLSVSYITAFNGTGTPRVDLG